MFLLIVLWILNAKFIPFMCTCCYRKEHFPDQKMNNFFEMCSFQTLRDELAEIDAALITDNSPTRKKSITAQSVYIKT